VAIEKVGTQSVLSLSTGEVLYSDPQTNLSQTEKTSTFHAARGEKKDIETYLLPVEGRRRSQSIVIV